MGNYVDVIKYFCWIGVINVLKKKDKFFMFFDIYVGVGVYDLIDVMLLKNKEYEMGIFCLFIDDKGV